MKTAENMNSHNLVIGQTAFTKTEQADITSQDCMINQGSFRRKYAGSRLTRVISSSFRSALPAGSSVMSLPHDFFK
jgi:hypothetical protein